MLIPDSVATVVIITGTVSAFAHLIQHWVSKEQNYVISEQEARINGLNEELDGKDNNLQLLIALEKEVEKSDIALWVSEDKTIHLSSQGRVLEAYAIDDLLKQLDEASPT